MKTRKLMRMVHPLGWIVIAAAISGLVMLLWNWLVPSIFGLTAIGYWQALGLLVLARILFGGFGRGRRMMHGNMMYGMHGGNPIRDKWQKMTPEEREEFINKRRAHMHGGRFGSCGFNFDAGDHSPKENE